MKKQYHVAEPSDFLPPIEDIINWYKKSKKKNLIISLVGDLGAGKTTFVKELGFFFGIKETITSPTFTIMKMYEISDSEFNHLVHIDAYRIESEEEMFPLRIEEVLTTSKSVICIEWPEKIFSLIPKDVIKVSLSIEKEETRLMKVDFGDV